MTACCVRPSRARPEDHDIGVAPRSDARAPTRAVAHREVGAAPQDKGASEVGVRRQEKAAAIAAQLEALYPETPVPLDHTDPFTLLVAVVLSAQTTDKKVNEVTPALFAEGGTPETMARLGEDRIRWLIREIGLNKAKARHLDRLAHLLLERHDGQVPASFEALEALPGVGHKTASVVMAQAFGVPAFPVDTHIDRLARRWGLTRGKTVEHTERDLKAVFPREQWNKLHLQIIFFGREHCPARWHDLDACPICSWAATAKQKALERAENDALRSRRRA